MKMYGALLSPFVRKVAVVLAEKGVDYTPARGGPGNTDPEFLAVSPFAKIPAIDDEGFCLADSSAIVHYLEAKYPAPALIPSEPQALGRAVWFDEFGDTIFAASGLKILFNRVVGPRFLGQPGDETIALEGEAELPRIFAYIESVVPDAGWLLGETFTIADITVASMLCTLRYVGHGPNPEAYPRTAAWHARALARPSWAAVEAKEAALMQRILPDLVPV
ncbi:glutathione S-transferase [Novosphingobium fuchskuhlense]|uniref:Glutathione S-transferase n=1 Tax=Novosphingobium fuchskuhlense TaxID=1117702 RepID=A0A124JW03_9SPHN|nr:glutathione S-transferase family protein [Novosphingobium fuchskuhlense]KUR72830.1 glutathione S-transferase [Novosphingobium fuchskuhlense]